MDGYLIPGGRSRWRGFLASRDARLAARKQLRFATRSRMARSEKNRASLPREREFRLFEGGEASAASVLRVAGGLEAARGRKRGCSPSTVGGPFEPGLAGQFPSLLRATAASLATARFVRSRFAPARRSLAFLIATPIRTRHASSCVVTQGAITCTSSGTGLRGKRLARLDVRAALAWSRRGSHHSHTLPVCLAEGARASAGTVLRLSFGAPWEAAGTAPKKRRKVSE